MPIPLVCDGVLAQRRIFHDQPYMWNGLRCKVLFSRFHHMGTVRSYVRPTCAVMTAGLDEVREAGGWIKGRALCASRVSAYPASGFVPWFIVCCAPYLPAVAGQFVSAVLRLCGGRSCLNSYWVSINSTSGQQCPDHPGDLIGERHRYDLEGTPRKHVLQPRPNSVAILHMT